MDATMNTTAGFDDAALDSAWADEGSGWEAADEAQIPEADQPEGGQQPADQPAATETDTDPAQQEAAAPADQPELFDIMYRGQKEQLTREQMITMAQKGRDYDTVRAERDQLRQYRSEADPALELVKGYAQRNGMTVPEYLDYCRTQELMRGGMDEGAATQTLQFEKRKAELDAQQAQIDAQQAQQNSALQKARQQQEERRRDMDAFLKAYPGVKAESIPKEVWAKVAGGDSLVNAYTMHENQRLQAELAAERQNKENRQRTPGSLGANSGAEMDEIDRLWADDD